MIDNIYTSRLQKALEKLQQPFGLEQGLRFKVTSVIVAGLFIGLMLIIGRPFNTNNLNTPLQFLILSGYGLITTLVSAALYIVIPALLPKIFDEDRWTLGKHIVHLWCICTVIAVCNYIYTIAFYPNVLPSLKLFLFFLGVTPLLGLPIMVTVTIFVDRTILKRRIAEAEAATAHLREIHAATETQHINYTALAPFNTIKVHTVSLQGIGKNEYLEIPMSQLLIIEASGNYGVVYHIEEGMLKKTLLRCTLKQIEQQLEAFPHIVRCHKSYIANVYCVKQVSGSAQGYQLQIPLLDFLVPVSRSFYRSVLNIAPEAISS